jgi:large subunit ribosomal protein LP0
MRAAILELQNKDEADGVAPRKHLELIRAQLVLNTGMIFTNGDLTEVKSILDSQVREAPAKIGAIAPADVTIPAGPTGMDPKQTSFF